MFYDDFRADWTRIRKFMYVETRTQTAAMMEEQVKQIKEMDEKWMQETRKWTRKEQNFRNDYIFILA